MLPYWGTLSHLFEDHDHKTCEISQTHIHEIEIDCDILDYQFPSSIEISYKNKDNAIFRFQSKKTSFFYLGYSYSIDTVDKLRGPPSV